MKRTLALLLVALPLFAQRSPADYERYLIPVLTSQPLPGAYQSLWSTSFWIRNDGPETADVFPLSPACVTSSVCFTRMSSPMPAGGSLWHSPPQYLALSSGARPNGAFLYVQRTRARQISMRLGVSDVSRTPAGSAEIPVVPESEFFDTARSILGVKIVPGTRVALRIYTADERPEASVIVRVHELVATPFGTPGIPFRPRLLGERTLAFTYDEAGCAYFDCPAGIRYTPSTIQIGNLLDAFPEIATALARGFFGLRVEIEPATPGLRYWPLVTETRDADGYVSVYTVR